MKTLTFRPAMAVAPAKKAFDEREPTPRPSEAAFMAACNLLVTGKSTREERRMAVRLLLRQASKSLERGA